MVFSPIKQLLLHSPPPPLLVEVYLAKAAGYSALPLLPRLVVHSSADLLSAVVVEALEGCSPPLPVVVVVVDCSAPRRPHPSHQVDLVTHRVLELLRYLEEAHSEEWWELAVLQLVLLAVLVLVVELVDFLPRE